MNPTLIVDPSPLVALGRCATALQDRVARDYLVLQKEFAIASTDYTSDASSTKVFVTMRTMRVLKMPITNRRRPVTNRSHPHPLDDRKGNLTPLHLQILQWVEGRGPGDSRPRIEGLSFFAIDTAVAELVLMDLVKAVSVPQSRYDRAHWEPTGLTATGWRVLIRHRRSQPRPVTHSWWRLRLWG